MEASQTPAARALGTLRATGLVGLLVVVLGLAGAVLLVVAELSDIVTIEVLTTGTCEEIAAADARDECEVDGIERHGGALFVLGAFALLLALAAGFLPAEARAGRVAAAAALVVIGLVVAGLAVRDFSASDETGLVGITFENAEAGLDRGFYYEVAGAALCVVAGGLGIARRRD